MRDVQGGQSIGDVERETGLTKETLRVWERRYHFPLPARDAIGQRVYLPEDIDRLRLIKRLIDIGHRPGRIIQLAPAELQALAEARNTLSRLPLESGRMAELQACIELCRSNRIEDLRYKLAETMLQDGLYDFVINFLAPLNVMVGEAWASGKIAVFEEHIYTESVQVLMRQAIASIPSKRAERGQMPRLMLTTLPQERHGLGLLMVEALAALEGATCLSLGVQTPIGDIVMAVLEHRIDIVALSFSLAMGPRRMLDGLLKLRASLPSTVEIWAGGSAALLKKCPSDVQVLSLCDIAPSLDVWRTRQIPKAC